MHILMIASGWISSLVESENLRVIRYALRGLDIIGLSSSCIQNMLGKRPRHECKKFTRCMIHTDSHRPRVSTTWPPEMLHKKASVVIAQLEPRVRSSESVVMG